MHDTKTRGLVTLDPRAIAALRRRLTAAIVDLDDIEVRARRSNGVQYLTVDTLRALLAEIGTECSEAIVSLDFALAAS